MLFEERGTFKGTFSANIRPNIANSKMRKIQGFTGVYGYFGREFKPRSFHQALKAMKSML